MFVGNISQYEKESRFLPEYIRPWIEKLSSLVKSDLNPGRHTFDTVNYMNVDVTETAPASQRLMEAHRDCIDVQYVLEGEENIGWQPLCQAGPVVDDSRADSDAWFYNPDVADDTVIAMTPGTYAIFTPADGHRCLCAPDGQGKAIKKAILKLHV